MDKHMDTQSTLVESRVGDVSVLSVTLGDEVRTRITTLQDQFRDVFNKYLNPDGSETFFISPHVFQIIAGIIPIAFKQLNAKMGAGDSLQSWEHENISAILGKALIPDSLSPTLSNARAIARDVAEFHAGRGRVVIRELCTGAGLATAMTWMEVRKAGAEGVTIISTDNALESVVTAALVLSIFNIPHVIIQGEVPDALFDFDGVVLQYMDAGDAVRNEQGRSKQYSVVFSDHGISYFPQKVNDEIIGSLLGMLTERGVMYVCGLEPDVTVALQYPFMIREILFGRGLRRDAYTQIRQGRERTRAKGDEQSVIYDTTVVGGRTAVTRFYTPESAGLYDMLHAFLFNKDERSLSTCVLYIRSIIGVVRTTKKLGVEIRSPIEHSLRFVGGLMEGKYDASAIPPFEDGKRVARTLRVQMI
ncbi:hypothetical protein JW887_00830 [Candidatus Dojkabacteria bacterium]|nr:hypothetical protein [Candidatus Dojkabacteria bacterium]